MNTTKTLFTLLLLVAILPVRAETTKLDENCVINILNRTIQVNKESGWAVPNVPSNMGRVRARATCTKDDGTTVSGQSDYFTLTTNGVTNVGDITFEGIEAIPTEASFFPSSDLKFTAVGQTQQLKVIAKYAAGNEKDVTAAINGINYSTTNTAIVTVNAEGIITSKGNGVALVNARKDGVLASKLVSVNTSGDLDSDGIPDDWEIANGLNPNDPVDAQEDKDLDGLTALGEYNAGTNPSLADTDGDGLNDFREIKEIKTSALLTDTDGDGINDNVELLTNTDPLKSSSVNYAAALQSISVSPSAVVMTFNGVDSEVSKQLKVTGKLIDGSSIDLTSKSRGTTYSSSDLSVVNFGTEDGKIYGSKAGNAVVTIKNNSFSIPLAITVDLFTASALSAISIPDSANDVDVAGDYAYIASGNAGLQIVNVSNRKLPKIVGSLDTNGYSYDVIVRGNLVYLADGEAGLKIIDVSDPLNPKLLSSLNASGTTQDIQLNDDFAFLANGSAGIEVIDISKSTEPHSISTLTNIGQVKGVDVENNIVVIVTSSSLYTVDASDKRGLVKLGSVLLGDVKDVVVKSGFAYVAAYADGYKVVDFNNPLAPKVVGGGKDFYPNDVELDSTGLAFFAEVFFPNALPYVNIQSPQNPVYQGVINLYGLGDANGTGIALDSSYAYITQSPSSFYIAQHRALSDNAGIPPTIKITSPLQNSNATELQEILLTVDAQDDTAVKQVEFLIDGVVFSRDTKAPYETSFSVNDGKRFVNVSARAIDIGGNVTLSEIVRVNILRDRDKDDLEDGLEVDVYKTNPVLADTDGDGIKDGREITLSTNPLVADSDGDGIADGIELGQGTDPLNPNTNKPLVESSSPSIDQKGVIKNKAIIVRFTEALSAKSITPDVFTLRQSGVEVEGRLSLISQGRELLFKPTTALENNTDYAVEIVGVRNLAGNLLPTRIEFHFETGSQLDTASPSILSATPVNGTNNVPVNSPLIFEFNEQIDPTSLETCNCYVNDISLNRKAEGVFSLSDDKTILVFSPNQPLKIGQAYQVSISNIKDLAGNVNNQTNINFTTSAFLDKTPPKVVATTIVNGDSNIPTNTQLRVLFDEPISAASAKQLTITQNDIAILVKRSIEDDGHVLMVSPVVPLTANTSYKLHIGVVSDLSGNLLQQVQSIDFSTGSSYDIVAGSLDQLVPIRSQTRVPLNVQILAKVSERMDLASATNRTLLLRDSNGSEVNGEFTASADRFTLKFIPAKPLNANHVYTVYYNYFHKLNDLAGNRFSDSQNESVFSFTTGSTTNLSPLSLVRGSFESGSNNVPINVKTTFQFNQSLTGLCVTSNTVRLVNVNTGALVPGVAIIQGEDFQNLYFEPSVPLSPSTEYRFELSGLCNLSGGVLAPLTHSFNTRADSFVDFLSPNIRSWQPILGATEVDSKSNIIITFDEPIDATKLEGLSVTASGVSGQIAGAWQVQGNTLNFVPASGYPSGATITVSVSNLYDLAGNQMFAASNSFTSGAAVDKEPPRIESISPENGAMDINPSSSVVLTFSESLLESSINNEGFYFFIDGKLISPKIFHSADNKSVTLMYNLPAGKAVSVVVTDSVMDIAGNRTEDYVSTFNTAIEDGNPGRPYIVAQYPLVPYSMGIRELKQLVLYSSSALDSRTIDGNVALVINGVAADFTWTLEARNQAISIVPNVPFPENALISVFAADKIKNVTGQYLYSYQGQVRTGNRGGSKLGKEPTLESYSPSNSLVMSLNPVIEAKFDQPLNASTINSTNVKLKERDGAKEEITAIVSLVGNGQIVRITPTLPLTPQSYQVTFNTDIQDVDGDKVKYISSMGFSIDQSAVVDNRQPIVLSTSPYHGAADVPVNTYIHVRFDEAINTLSGSDDVRENGYLFSWDKKEILYAKDHAFAENAEQSIDVSNFKDVSGNTLVGFSLTFFTNDAVDFTEPKILNISPALDSINIPLNASVKILYSEPLAAAGINQDQSWLIGYSGSDGTSYDVVTKTSVSGDGKLITITPVSALKPKNSYTIPGSIVNFYDFAHNRADFSYHMFSTGIDADLASPLIEYINIEEGQNDVPLNPRVVITFNEPMDVTSLGGVKLIGVDGAPIVVTKEMDKSSLILTPLQLLKANTAYNLKIQDVKDLAGNMLALNKDISFRTSASVDALKPKVVSLTPTANAHGVPLNSLIEVSWSERINPFIKTPIRALSEQDQSVVDGFIEVSEDRKRQVFVHDQPLKPFHEYKILMGKNDPVSDIAGNIGRLSNDELLATFTTGNATDLEPPELLTSNVLNSNNIPVNVQVSLAFNEPLYESCVNINSVQLVKVSNSEVISGSVLLTQNKHNITFVPTVNLTPASTYKLSVNGICDLSGNKLTGALTQFTTSNSNTPDLGKPNFTSMTPQSDAINIDANSKIVMTFNETIDSTKLDGLQVTATGYAVQLPGTWDASGNTLTFTPQQSFPSSATINVFMYGIFDLAGNEFQPISRSFVTGLAVDNIAPEVVQVTPSNGTMSVGTRAPIVLTFSESLDENTITNENFVIFSNGSSINTEIYHSVDNKTVTLYPGSLPSESTVSVAVLGDVADLAGNRIVGFVSTFNTLSNSSSSPYVLKTFPSIGATNVMRADQITLQLSHPISPDKLRDGVLVTANNKRVLGTSSLDPSHQFITFKPEVAFPDNEIVEFFFTGDLAHISSNAWFSTGSDKGEPNARPYVQATYPGNQQSDVVLNPVIDALFNEPIKLSSVNANTVQVREGSSSGPIQPIDISLSENKKLLHIKPATVLLPNMSYFVYLSGNIEDVGGVLKLNSNSFSFKTGENAVIDNQRPSVIASSPSSGLDGVPVRPSFSIRFDEAINPLSQIDNIQVSVKGENKEVTYLRGDVLPINTEITETLSGFFDMAGNPMNTYTISFKTGAVFDNSDPQIVASSPQSGSENVPTNAIVEVKISKPIDMLSVSDNTFYIFEQFGQYKQLGANISLNPDRTSLSLIPLEPLEPNSIYEVRLSYQDLYGNAQSTNWGFKTGQSVDSTAPQVDQTGIVEGQSSVPLNAHIRVHVNEAIANFNLDQIVLVADDVPVITSKYLSYDQQMITLTPTSLLSPNTAHTLKVIGIQDLGGNSILPSELHFTTGNKIEPSDGCSIKEITPTPGSVNVPLASAIEVNIDQTIDFANMNTMRLRGGGDEVSGKYSISTDRKRLLWTPVAPLMPLTDYHFSVYDSSISCLSGGSHLYEDTYFKTAAQ